MCAQRLLGRSKSFIPEDTRQEKVEFSRDQRHYRSMKDVSRQRGQLSCRRKASPVVKLRDGFLWMQSSPHINKSWKLRYIMLLEEKLCYLKEKRDKMNLQVSQAAEWKMIKISDIVSLKVSTDGATHHDPVQPETDIFHIKTPHSKYLFKCRNQDERDNWMAAILTAKSSSLVKER